MPHLPEMSQCLRLSKQHFSIFWKPISYPSDKFMQIGIISLSLSKFFPGISVQRYRLIIFIFLRFRLCYFPNLFNCFITCCLCLLPVDKQALESRWLGTGSERVPRWNCLFGISSRWQSFLTSKGTTSSTLEWNLTIPSVPLHSVYIHRMAIQASPILPCSSHTLVSRKGKETKRYHCGFFSYAEKRC